MKPIVIRNTSSQPADDLTILKAALRFANGGDLVLEQDHQERRRATDADREEFMRPLLKVMSAPRSMTLADLGPICRRFDEELKLRMGFTIDANCSIQRNRLIEFETVGALLAYALATVLETGNKFGSMVSRCKLPACGKLYLATKNPKGGKPNLVYCTPAHRVAHHDSSARRLGKV